jgi:taurine dioxygenase
MPGTMKFQPLTEGFGTEILGADLAQLGDEDFGRIWQTWLERHLVVIRAQNLTAQQFHAFAQRLGQPQPHVINQFHHPEIADILILSNVLKDGKPTGLQDAGTYFHTDYSYLAQPARCTTLYSIQVPERDGQRFGATLFADQQAAYEALGDDMKARIDPLIGRHHYGNREDLDRSSRTVASVLTQEQEEKMQWVRHRIARPHPLSGRKALYAVSGSSFGIEDMPEQEAFELLDELKRHATQPRFQFALTYGVGDVVVWDNAALLHSATLIDPALPRTLWRVTLLEDLQRLEALPPG